MVDPPNVTYSQFFHSFIEGISGLKLSNIFVGKAKDLVDSHLAIADVVSLFGPYMPSLYVVK